MGVKLSPGVHWMDKTGAAFVHVQCIAIFAVDFAVFNFSCYHFSVSNERNERTIEPNGRSRCRRRRCWCCCCCCCRHHRHRALNTMYWLASVFSFSVGVWDFYICEVVGPLPLCRLIECTYYISFSWIFTSCNSSIAFDTLQLMTNVYVNENYLIVRIIIITFCWLSFSFPYGFFIWVVVFFFIFYGFP